ATSEIDRVARRTTVSSNIPINRTSSEIPVSRTTRIQAGAATSKATSSAIRTTVARVRRVDNKGADNKGADNKVADSKVVASQADRTDNWSRRGAGTPRLPPSRRSPRSTIQFSNA